MTDPYPLLVKALGYFNSTRPGSDKCLYDLLAEHSKKSCRWLVPNSEKSKETSPIAANPTIVREISDVIEETTTSSGSSLKEEEGEEEVVELVLPSSSITMAKSDTGNSGGHDDDDEISKFMSEHGLLMVTEEEQEQESSIRDSQLDDDVEEMTVPKKRSKIESLSDEDEDEDDNKKNEVEEDDEETDSCDDFEGFEANTKQSGTAPVKSGAGRPTKAGPPPLRKIPSFARRISVEKGSATSGGRSSPAGFFQESSYAGGNSIRGMSPVEGAAQARRLSQMRKQAVKLSQNSKAPVKK